MLNTPSSNTQSLSPVLPQLAQQLSQLDSTQLAWLSGYSWALSQHRHTAADANGADADPQAEAADLNLHATTAAAASSASAEPRRILVLSCSQTGNAAAVAKALYAQLQALGTDAQISLSSAADYRSRSLPEEDIVLLVTSTQGEGEAPEEAVPLYKFIYHKKTPDLSQVSFAVLGLGDSSYPHFNQAAKDFDERFAELGAKRLLDRIDCDLDYQASADAWRQRIEDTISKLVKESNPVTNTAINDVTSSATVQSVGAAAEAPAISTYDKKHPYTAELLTKQRITTENANEVMHYEIDLEGSGITYQAGDSLGVYFLNSDALVEEILRLSQINGNDRIALSNGEVLSIAEALKTHLNLTESTPQFIRDYAVLLNAAGDHRLDELAASDAQSIIEYIENRPPVLIMAEYPLAIPNAQQLHDLFRPLTPRLYSISSAQEEVGDEVHITVKTVRYNHNGTDYQGAASGYLADRLEEGDEVKVFIESNPHFRLPQDPTRPIIMIGAGTGIAPFRSFLQARQANGDSGANWLIFGNQRFTEDFLYQSEWIQLNQAGVLNKYDFAWSRQGKEKEYVQHKLAQRAAEVWQWLQDGAHIYVCGDAKRMAKAVEDTLLQIIGEEGQLAADEAEDYLNELREEKRYQRDVY